MYGHKDLKKAPNFNSSLIMKNSFDDFNAVKKFSSRNNSITHYSNKLLGGQSNKNLYSKNYSIAKHKRQVREVPATAWTNTKKETRKG